MTNGDALDAELTFIGNENVPNVLIFTEHINATYYISFDIPLKELHAQKEVNFAVVSQNFVGQHGLQLGKAPLATASVCSLLLIAGLG